jgi:plastocyanin
VPRLLGTLIAVATVALALTAAPASAEVRQLAFRVGPIGVAPYEVRQNGIDIGIPKPDVDGFITAMDANIVDGRGRPVPIQRLMLHHIVFANVGAAFGEKKDATCDTFTNLDSVSTFPAAAERFYGAGEERAQLRLPPGYGYPVGGKDQWTLTWMVMNHRAVADKAYIQYRVTYDTSLTLTPVRPVWMDVRNCRADPVYDVAGGGAPGSEDRQTEVWTAPEAGRIVAGGGHVHGGGDRLELSQPDCGDRLLATSTPTWGTRAHPFYNVRPVLHEPGPIHMSAFTTPTGFPVAAGQKLKLTSFYDAERPHTRVMGIMQFFFAPGGPPAGTCAPLPADVATDASPPGRKLTPRVTVPLTGLDARGRARTIAGPPGRFHRAAGDALVDLRNLGFSRPNLSVPRGATVRWRFKDDGLHDVTVASGPRGFSSPHQAAGATFEQQLRVPGTYRLFCSLHPVRMTERVVVRR